MKEFAGDSSSQSPETVSDGGFLSGCDGGPDTSLLSCVD